MDGRYSTRSPAVKRLMREAQELCEPTDQYFAQPLEDNLFEWHFTIRGPLDSDFQAGLYHGRIILPVDYPMKPPSIIWLTPNGRFETNKKICLSISGHHPESWQPSWSIRTALLAIIGFMPTHPGGAIGSLDYKPEERKALAKKSRDWKCPVCGDVSEILLEPSPESNQTSQEAKELASQISFQGEKPKTADNKSNDEPTASSPPLGNTTTTTTPSTEGASATASPTTTTASTPLDTPPTSAGQTTASGSVYPPWACPPGLAASNSAVPPPFMQYPWTCLSMPQGGQLGSIASQIPRFPYPPSYYANNAGAFYPTGFPFPSGMGMFPCPFPPPPTTFGYNINPPVSVNNSSLSPPDRSPDRGSHSHSPDAPRIPNIPPPSPASVVSSQAGSSAPVSPQCSPLKEHVLNELLSKVKRVGSEVHVPSNAAMDSDMKREAAANSQTHVESDSTVVKKIPDSCIPCKQAAELISAQANTSEIIPDVMLEDAKEVQDVLEGPDHATNLEPLTSQIVNISTISEALKCAFDVADESAEVNSRPHCDGSENQQDGGENHIGDQCPMEDKSQVTDTDISVSLMRKESINESTGMEISHSELSADPGDDGELGNLALEVSDTEQRSHFERSTSSSMPDLKKKLKLGTAKGLRQRQSAFARVPCETAADEQTLSEQASSGSGRQRIEAVSGDSFANQQRFNQNAANAENEAAQNRANLAYQAARRTPERQANSTFDVSFMVMIGLCVTTVFILLNRLFYMIDFSAVFY